MGFKARELDWESQLPKLCDDRSRHPEGSPLALPRCGDGSRH